ncbi:MAG: oligosaccharide flippase family protein [Theionarchaea archaeon]|nr:oligosaccharide flippase family protein [Theionarchaea archaeon]
MEDMEDFSKFFRGFSITGIGVIYSGAVFYLGALLAITLLGPKEYGMFSLAYMVPSIAVFFLLFGLDVTAARYIAHNLGERKGEKALHCAQTIFVMKLLTAVLSMTVFFFLSDHIAKFLGEGILLGLQVFSVYIFLYLVGKYLMAVLQGYFLFKQRTIAEAVGSTFSMVLLIPFVYLGWGYLSPILALVLSYGFLILLSVYFLERAKIPVLRIRFEGLTALKNYLKFSFYVYVSDSFHTAYVWVGTIVIAFYSMPVETVGHYRAMFSITNTIILVSYGFTVVLYPMLSEFRARKEHKKLSFSLLLVIKYTLGVSIPAALGMLFLSQPLLSFLFPEYVEAVTLLRIFSFRMIFLPVYSILATALLILDKAKEQALLSIGLCSISVVLSLIFGLFSVEGIAVANTIGLAGVVFVQYLILKQQVGGVHPGPIVKFCFSTAVMCGIIWLILQLDTKDAVKVFSSVIGGIVVYTFCVLKTGAVSEEDLDMIHRGLFVLGPLRKILEPVLIWLKRI